ncbi:2OG-FeII_Oxy_2 domain-containing protein [Cephalotus follicularis]|uniref:2OG-FeII_Oxy_2 domain-containing protein n=1 Tax=Cephalotus follicularis TaxID=3775 RepID=A0A1Q3BQF3_CEPFO|nr:2OG-FeII_Oxy_2 domain-containing protein [Cephalotus follicularis]
MSFTFKAVSNPKSDTISTTCKEDSNSNPKSETIDLGSGSQIVYIPRFLAYDDACDLFHYINNNIPWTRPTIRVFGRSVVQPRDTCYVASAGLPELTYSGYQPQAYLWDDFPPLKDILEAVHKELPESRFNSLLLNRYKDGNDCVGWHADDEKLYGSTLDIASVSFGCERDFLLREKPSKSFKEKRSDDKPPSKRTKKNSHANHHSFRLKHGSLLVMRGHTQRDWVHSVPRRAKADAIRINLTFRHVL